MSVCQTFLIVYSDFEKRTAWARAEKKTSTFSSILSKLILCWFFSLFLPILMCFCFLWLFCTTESWWSTKPQNITKKVYLNNRILNKSCSWMHLGIHVTTMKISNIWSIQCFIFQIVDVWYLVYTTNERMKMNRRHTYIAISRYNVPM